MTEKEKMLAGELYCGFDKELLEERQHAKEMIFEYNVLHPTSGEKRKEILRKLFGKIQEDIFIESPFYCDYGYNITVGRNFFVNYNCVMLDCAKITIGSHVLIGPNVGIYTATHPISPKLRSKDLEYAKPITIGNNVWIGGNTIINPGVKIGDNSIIGSGSVITKDIPENVVAVGNPCRVIKKIQGEEL